MKEISSKILCIFLTSKSSINHKSNLHGFCKLFLHDSWVVPVEGHREQLLLDVLQRIAHLVGLGLRYSAVAGQVVFVCKESKFQICKFYENVLKKLCFKNFSFMYQNFQARLTLKTMIFSTCRVGNWVRGR